MTTREMLILAFGGLETLAFSHLLDGDWFGAVWNGVSAMLIYSLYLRKALHAARP